MEPNEVRKISWHEHVCNQFTCNVGSNTERRTTEGNQGAVSAAGASCCEHGVQWIQDTTEDIVVRIRAL